MKTARIGHEAWSKQAHGQGQFGLATAVERYRKRYGRPPPPHFDKWYNYATIRSSLVINDFDKMESNLLPFWSKSPEEVREATAWEISHPGNGVGSISIRNKTVMVGPFVPDTHRWMLEGICENIRKYIEWLPDMDLAFNVNDEPRVAVPYDKMVEHRSRGKDNIALRTDVIRNTFSNDREAQWLKPENLPDPSFADRPPFQPSYYNYGSTACPPNSAAHKARVWNVRDLCVSCTQPYSVGHFILSWSLAGSVCNQPDLADLHGFYTSPSSFYPTQELRPVFSQSKPDGFADILYPSAWNYMDKIAYYPRDGFPDRPFYQKQSALFWRGSSSEGVSAGWGAWQGMTRQRFVHIVNNATGPQSVLLPVKPKRSFLPFRKNKDGKKKASKTAAKRYTYQDLPSSKVRELFNTNVSFTGRVARCGNRDCDAQYEHFGIPFPDGNPGVDFQEHWQYQYLFDTDGAGFSGRFLPFLQSRSLPFKAALFREWYDDRLAPWLHFVPVDTRLHGLWSALAFFAGVDEGKGEAGLKMDGHEWEAERMADEGRKWANLVLRKEDMEVYMFRLLLEWGRITDDKRDEIGFSVGGQGSADRGKL